MNTWKTANAVVDAPFEGGVRRVTRRREPACGLRVREDAGGWAR